MVVKVLITDSFRSRHCMSGYISKIGKHSDDYVILQLDIVFQTNNI